MSTTCAGPRFYQHSPKWHNGYDDDMAIENGQVCLVVLQIAMGLSCFPSSPLLLLNSHNTSTTLPGLAQISPHAMPESLIWHSKMES